MQKNKINKILLEDRVKFATVSGIYSTKPGIVGWVDKNIPEIDVITTKSFQVIPTLGNRESVVAEVEVGCFGNAVGLRNPGMDEASRDLAALGQLRCLLNVSLAGSSIDNFVTLVRKFEHCADFYELNFSCPHAEDGFGSCIGSDPKIVAQYVERVKAETSLPVFPKLTPNVDDIGAIARAAIDAGADGIVAINTEGPECFIEPHTGQPILYNPQGNLGGKSGTWILELAIECVQAIRAAIGNDYPIIGMGGVSCGKDVARMIDAGANVVGLGSVLAQVYGQDKKPYFTALKADAVSGTDHASQYIYQGRIAEYQPYKIEKIIEIGDSMRIFELAGDLEYLPSQYAFLWVPGVGEKPFSVGTRSPLSFIVRKQPYDLEKEIGLVTHGLFQLKVGEEMMIRGVYGADSPDSDKKNAFIVAGGTGIAVVPELVKKLKGQNKNVVVYSGLSRAEEVAYEDEIRKYAEYIPVTDDGIRGRVLRVLEERLAGEDINDSCFYTIGPVPLMKGALDIAEQAGASDADNYCSLETNNYCGIGMCGLCECGGRLTCQEGTFFSLEYFKEHQVDIMKFAH